MTKENDYVRSIYDGHRNNPAKNRKAIIEGMYFRLFAQLACARFKWVDLPDSVDERFLELTLFQRALVVFYFDNDFDKFLALRGAGNGLPNMYDNPKGYRVLGNQDIPGKNLSAKDCVPIWSNSMRMPDHDIAMLYATKLAEIDRTIEIDLLAMRHPFVMMVDDNEKQSVLQAFRMVQEGQPVIVGTNALGDLLANKANVLNMHIDKDVVPNLQIVKSKMWNECMTFLGINNSNQEKRERLVSSEVDANNSQVVMARNVALDARRRAALEINDKFGLDISVEWNEDPLDTAVTSLMTDLPNDPSSESDSAPADDDVTE